MFLRELSTSVAWAAPLVWLAACVGSVPAASDVSVDTPVDSESETAFGDADSAVDSAPDFDASFDAASVAWLQTSVAYDPKCTPSLNVDDGKTYYVSNRHGDDSDSGFSDGPLQTIAAAIAKARADNFSHLIVEVGTYGEELAVTPGSPLFIEGGYLYNGGTGDWTRDCTNGDITFINSPTAVGADVIGTTAEFRNLTITTIDAANGTSGTPAGSTYGVIARNGTILALRGVTLSPGNGGAGYPGLTVGSTGSTGANSAVMVPAVVTGDAGDVGEAGATVPACTCAPAPTECDAGDASTCGVVAGAAGAKGAPGAVGVGSLTPIGGFVPGDGASGVTGRSGGSGSVGGPGMKDTVSMPPPDCTNLQAQGAAGACGCGGSGGLGGAGGGGGGASIGVFVDGPSVYLMVDGVTIVTADGGNGAAGAAGGLGGSGGTGVTGEDNTSYFDVGCNSTEDLTGGSPGGNGGQGGQGGIGGTGAGGPSWPVAILQGWYATGPNSNVMTPGQGGTGGRVGDTSKVYTAN